MIKFVSAPKIVSHLGVVGLDNNVGPDVPVVGLPDDIVLKPGMI